MSDSGRPIFSRESIYKYLPLAAVFLLLSAIRGGLFWEHLHHPLFSYLRIDEREYAEWISEVIAGRYFLDIVPNHGPGYPWLVGALMKIAGSSLAVPRVAQMFLGLGSAAMAYLIAARLFDKRAGIVSALLWGLYPAELIFEQRILAASLFVFLCLVSFHLFLLARERGGWTAAVLAGAVAGYAAITRPTALVFAAAAAAWLLYHAIREKSRQKTAAAVLLAIAAVLVMAPIMWHNHRLAGRGYMIQMNAGMNLYLGNNPDSDGTPYARPGGTWDRIESMPWREAGVIEFSGQNEFFERKVREFAVEEPLEFLRLQVLKLGLLVNRREARATIDPDFHRRLFRATSLPLPGLALVLALALPGLLSLRGRDPGHQLLIIYLLAFGLSTVISVVSSRYRLPFAAGVFALGGAGAIALYRTIREWRASAWPAWRQWLPFGLAALGVLVAHLPLGPSHSDAEELTHLGMAWKEAGDAGAARDFYRRALEDEPDYSLALAQLGVLAEEKGEWGEAADYYRRAESADPYYAVASYQLGLALWKMGRREESVEALRRAIDKRSHWTPALSQLALREWIMGLNQDAISRLERILEVWPGHEDVLAAIQAIKSGQPPPGDLP